VVFSYARSNEKRKKLCGKPMGTRGLGRQ
jgi:hypothetical protein